MRQTPGHLVTSCLVTFLLGITLVTFSSAASGQQPDGVAGKQADDAQLRIQYLEIVSNSANETCETLEKTHGVTFGKPVAELGNARIAELEGGGRIAVRGPLRDTEVPVVRPYLLVDDISAAVQAAEETGALVAMPPTEIPGQGTFAIYLLGGIEHGLWEN